MINENPIWQLRTYIRMLESNHINPVDCRYLAELINKWIEDNITLIHSRVYIERRHMLYMRDSLENVKNLYLNKTAIEMGKKLIEVAEMREEKDPVSDATIIDHRAYVLGKI